MGDGKVFNAVEKINTTCTIRKVHWSASTRVERGHVGSQLDEQLKNFTLTESSRKMGWGHPFKTHFGLVVFIDPTSRGVDPNVLVLDQPLHDVRLAEHC